MNFPFYIARRYLFSKKSHNAINVISLVSVCGVMVATVALVCALSVYNGFGDLVSTLFSHFDPELKITPRYGKVFDPADERIRQIRQLRLQFRFMGLQHVLLFFQLLPELTEQVIHGIIGLIHQIADPPDRICRVNHRRGVNIIRAGVGLFNDLIALPTERALRVLAALPGLLILLHHIVNAVIQPVQKP